MTLLTEAEAKQKWCPLARVYNPDLSEPSCTFNRYPCGGGAADTDAYKAGCSAREVNCIGSACMAWRWFDDGDRVTYETGSARKPPGELNPPFSNCPEGFEVISHDSHGWFQHRREISREPPRGYCGAFGKAEGQ